MMQKLSADLVVVFIMAGSAEEAEKIAKDLVEGRLAACVNVVPQVGSWFFWDEKLCREGETLLVAKSSMALWDRLVVRVKELHSYEVPEIIALPIVAGSEDYLRWVRDCLGEK